MAVGFTALSSCQRAEATRQEAGVAEPANVAAPRGAGDDQVALASLRAAAVETPSESVCGENMVLVEGQYCPKVQLNCKKYLDPKGRYEQFRCAEYGPSECLSKERRHLRF